jgi:two-component system OmpR family sensor kinase
VTLQRRLVVASVLLAVTILVAGLAILGVQRRSGIAALDEQLTDLARNPRAILAIAARDNRPAALTDALGDVYVGRLTADGRLVTLLAPSSDPGLVPRIRAGDTLTTPAGRGTTAGSAVRVRVVAIPLSGAARAVIAVPTTAADAATARLARTLVVAALAIGMVLGLVLWWVNRLGLRPIREMTAAADAIAAGDTARQVPAGPDGTEAAHLGLALNAMLDATRGSEERMRRFVADASHELRTPLTTLRGYSGLHASDPEAGDAMRRINAEAGRMSGLVDDLLTLTSLDAPHLRLGPVDVVAVLGDVAADLQVSAPDRDVTVDAPGRLLVEADADRLQQAVLALATNAVRHTPPSARIWLRAAAFGAHHVRIEVADDGPGIAAEHLPHLFDRFYRVDPGRAGSGTPGGSGLGLAVVAAIARAHGGTCAARSSPGQGAAFVLDLPLRPVG